MTKRPVSIEDARLVTVGALKTILKEERVMTQYDLRVALKEERMITQHDLRLALKKERLVTHRDLRIALKEERAITQHDLKIVLKEERVITLQEIRRLEEKMDGKFLEMDEKFVTNDRFDRSMTAIASSFNQVHDSIADLQKAITFIIQELGVMREENRNFRQEREQLYRTDIVHERKIDELDARVLKLEIAQ